MYKPDYDSLRAEAGFRWSVSHTYSALIQVTGISIRNYFLDISAGIELYLRGAPILRDLFGPDVTPSPLHTPPVSYGHVNGLGAGLVFPDDGEVSHLHVADSLHEGIRLAQRRVDFGSVGMAPFYLEYRKRLSAAFGGQFCALGYKEEGPITTAYTLRGDAVFYDPYDDPPLFKEFLRQLTDSAIAFTHFVCRVYGELIVDPRGAGMPDDVAAMFSPDMWEEFVLPYWRQYYRGVTSGRRSVHVEDLRPEHLAFLEAAEIAKYDPGISARLSPKIISGRSRVPFGWRLGSFHYPTLSEADVRDWVFQAVADGASSVFSTIEGVMCNPPTIRKVHAFIEAAKTAREMLEKGESRQAVGRLVTESGRRRFWDAWPDQKTPSAHV